MSQASQHSGLTPAEQRVMDTLVEAWNLFIALPNVDHDDQTDFRRAIHDGQRILATRIVARDYPECWQ